MKVTITIEDTEDGRVRVDSKPIAIKLIEMRKNDDLTPAAGYAVIALGAITKTCVEEAREKLMAGKAIMPPPKFSV